MHAECAGHEGEAEAGRGGGWEGLFWAQLPATKVQLESLGLIASAQQRGREPIDPGKGRRARINPRGPLVRKLAAGPQWEGWMGPGATGRGVGI